MRELPSVRQETAIHVYLFATNARVFAKAIDGLMRSFDAGGEIKVSVALYCKFNFLARVLETTLVAATAICYTVYNVRTYIYAAPIHSRRESEKRETKYYHGGMKNCLGAVR